MSSLDKQTYRGPRQPKATSIVITSSNITKKIKTTHPEKVGTGDAIFFNVNPDFEGGVPISLKLTPNWRRPYRAVITVSPSL